MYHENKLFNICHHVNALEDIQDLYCYYKPLNLIQFLQWFLFGE